MMVGEESFPGQWSACAECGMGETTVCASLSVLAAEGCCQECAFQGLWRFWWVKEEDESQ